MTMDSARALIDELEKAGKNAIFATYTPSGENGDFQIGDPIRIQSSSSMSSEATACALLAIAVQLNEELDLLPRGFLKGLAELNDDSDDS